MHDVLRVVHVAHQVERHAQQLGRRALDEPRNGARVAMGAVALEERLVRGGEEHASTVHDDAGVRQDSANLARTRVTRRRSLADARAGSTAPEGGLDGAQVLADVEGLRSSRSRT